MNEGGNIINAGEKRERVLRGNEASDSGGLLYRRLWLLPPSLFPIAYASNMCFLEYVVVNMLLPCWSCSYYFIATLYVLSFIS